MYLEGSLRRVVGLSWVVLAQSPTHSCSQVAAGPGVISQLLLLRLAPGLGWLELQGWLSVSFSIQLLQRTCLPPTP